MLPSLFTQPIQIFFDWAKSRDRTVRTIGVPIHKKDEDWADEVYTYEMKEYPQGTKYSYIIDTELKEITDKFDNTFEEVSEISYDFIKELNRGEIKTFNQLYNKFNKQIEELEELFPKLTKKIREFGIF